MTENITTARTHLELLASAGLVQIAQVEPELEYLFRHALVQDAAYASLLKQDRRRFHQATAETLERLYPDRLEELAATLAHHFSTADDARALKYFELAGDVAYRRYALPEAVGHYSRALEIATKMGPEIPAASLERLYSRRGRALELNAQYPEALENYAQMESLARTQDDPELALAAVVERAKIYCTPNPSFDPARGQTLAERALNLAQRLGDRPAEARVHWILMLRTWLTGETLPSLAHGERSLELACELGLTEQMAYTFQDVHRAYLNAGKPARAQEALSEARRLWQELDNLPMLADNLNSTADLLNLLGRYSEALDFAREAFDLSRSIGNLWNQAFARGMAGEAHVNRGDLVQALEAMQEAIDLSEQAGLVILKVRALHLQAWTYLVIGAIPQAHLSLDRSQEYLDSAETLFREGFRTILWALRSRVAVQDRDLAGAEVALRRCLSLQEATEAHWISEALLAQANLALAQGNYEQVHVLMDRLISEDRRRALRRSVLMEAYLFKAQALLAQGRPDVAGQILREALRREDLEEEHLISAQVLALLSDVEARWGNPARAAELRREAQDKIACIADQIEDPALQEAFLGLAYVRGIMAGSG